MLGRGTAQVLGAEDSGRKDLGGGDTLRLSLEEWRIVLRQSLEKAAGAEGGGRRPAAGELTRMERWTHSPGRMQKGQGAAEGPTERPGGLDVTLSPTESQRRVGARVSPRESELAGAWGTDHEAGESPHPGSRKTQASPRQSHPQPP